MILALSLATEKMLGIVFPWPAHWQMAALKRYSLTLLSPRAQRTCIWVGFHRIAASKAGSSSDLLSASAAHQIRTACSIWYICNHCTMFSAAHIRQIDQSQQSHALRQQGY